MYKGLTFIILTLITITSNIKSENNDYLKKVIDRLNSVEKELKSIQKPTSSNISTEKTNLKYLNSIANHEQRLVDIEEELRSLNGFLEEINHKIDNIINTTKQSNILKQSQNEVTAQPTAINNNNTILFEEKQKIVLKDPNIEKNPTMKVLGTVSESKKLEKIQESKGLKSINEQKVLSNAQLAQLSKNPSELYSYAYAMLIRENFIEAEKFFKAFIGEHPNDPLASNAYYWLGETYYVQKNFQSAAVSFARGFQKFPKGNKALDQLFKLALTFLNLGKNEDACATFSKLEAEFPEAPKRISNRAKEYIQRAKC